MFAHLQTAPTPDLTAECTTALVSIMLAQAQESFCIKAAKGGCDTNVGVAWAVTRCCVCVFA